MPMLLKTSGPSLRMRRDMRQRLNVVDDGRLAPQSALRRKWRLGRGMPRWPSIEAIMAVSSPQTNAPAPSITSHFIERPVPKTFLPRMPSRSAVRHGAPHALDCQRIFGANVDQRLVGANRARRDHQAFNHAVRIAFHHGAVHERAGVAFVAVADDILLGRILNARRFPLASGRESAAATAAQAGFEDRLADLLRRHLDESLPRRR